MHCEEEGRSKETIINQLREAGEECDEPLRLTRVWVTQQRGEGKGLAGPQEAELQQQSWLEPPLPHFLLALRESLSIRFQFLVGMASTKALPVVIYTVV